MILKNNYRDYIKEELKMIDIAKSLDFAVIGIIIWVLTIALLVIACLNR